VEAFCFSYHANRNIAPVPGAKMEILKPYVFERLFLQDVKKRRGRSVREEEFLSAFNPRVQPGNLGNKFGVKAFFRLYERGVETSDGLNETGIIQNQNCTKTKQNTNFSKNKLRSIQTKSQTAQNINSSFRLGFFALCFAWFLGYCVLRFYSLL